MQGEVGFAKQKPEGLFFIHNPPGKAYGFATLPYTGRAFFLLHSTARSRNSAAADRVVSVTSPPMIRASSCKRAGSSKSSTRV